MTSALIPVRGLGLTMLGSVPLVFDTHLRKVVLRSVLGNLRLSQTDPFRAADVVPNNYLGS